MTADARTSARLMSCVHITRRTTWFKQEEQMTNEEFLRRFDAHEKFDEDEIKEMCWGEVGKVLEVNVVDQGTWTISKELIFEVDSRFFSVFWTEGATEQQYDCEEYPDYPTEVRRIEKVAYDYVPIEEDN